MAAAGAAAIVVVAMAIGFWRTDASTTASGPVIARSLPPIELGDDGFVDENGPVEPEIALIDEYADEPPEPELTLASGPSLDELALD